MPDIQVCFVIMADVHQLVMVLMPNVFARINIQVLIVHSSGAVIVRSHVTMVASVSTDERVLVHQDMEEQIVVEVSNFLNEENRFI